MVWKLDFEKDGIEAWVDETTDRFVSLTPHEDKMRWVVRMGIRANTSQNQEATYKNRSRAVIQVRSLLKAKSWKNPD